MQGTISLNRNISRYLQAKKEQNTLQLRKAILASLKESKLSTLLLFSGQWKELIFLRKRTKTLIKIHY